MSQAARPGHDRRLKHLFQEFFHASRSFPDWGDRLAIHDVEWIDKEVLRARHRAGRAAVRPAANRGEARPPAPEVQRRLDAAPPEAVSGLLLDIPEARSLEDLGLED